MRDEDVRKRVLKETCAMVSFGLASIWLQREGYYLILSSFATNFVVNDDNIVVERRQNYFPYESIKFTPADSLVGRERRLWASFGFFFYGFSSVGN